MTPGPTALGETESRFLAEATAGLVAAVLGAAALAVLASVALARGLTRSLRAMTGAARDLAAGALGRQVEVKGADELAELAQAFNRMSRDLAEGEALRQRMTTDIAHELRTPVSVLQGHLEAMRDGVFPADAERLAVAHDQTLHLARLVDDLRTLTLAEAGKLALNRATVAPGDLAALHRPSMASRSAASSALASNRPSPRQCSTPSGVTRRYPGCPRSREASNASCPIAPSSAFSLTTATAPPSFSSSPSTMGVMAAQVGQPSV